MASTPRGLISPSQRGIPLSKISPAFLHANSTSHTWVFSAFAEIIDNAYDPDVSASELLIDKVDIRNVACLIFLDNGAGMDRDKLHKMLSFGFCEKDIFESSASHQPIGHYGNGFKSGSMRIGTDALVFTRSEHSASIGFLSQTYLNAIKAESVFVPILDYRLPKLERFKSQESRNNLNAILTYSVFKFEEELKAELRALEGSKTGTKIIISNLKRLENGNLELDFSSDPTDVRCPEAHEADMTSVYHRPVEQYTSEYKLSLREYCSILFLKPRMKITIRGHRVKSKLISKSLSQSEQDTYNPSWLANPVKIIFGFTCDKEKSEDYGLMLYHRNRLIKAFERVGYQKQPNDRGVGVVGVAQVDFLQPIHNKQDFKWDEKFNSVMKAFAIKLNEYWNEKMNTSNSGSSQFNGNLPDWTWAQCDHCLKWRRLPDSINPESLPEKWYCRYNTDGTHNRCDIPEEPEDEDMAVKPRFEKTFKKRQEEQKRQLRMRQIEEEAKKKQEMEKRLRQKEEELKVLQQLKQPVVDPRAHELEQALAQAQKYIEEQARLMEQMSSGVFPTPPPPSRKGQQNGSKNRPLAQSLPVSPMHHNQQTKKRATVESLPTKENKKLCIKTETGEVLAITRNFGDDEEAADDLPNTTVTKKTPKSKQGTKGDPLRVAMPFHVSKTNQNLEKQKNKQSSATASKSADKTPEKSSNGDVNFIDLTDDDEISKQPAIKQDPDAVAHDTSSTHGARQDSLDVKPDKASLDKQLTDITHEGLGEQEVAAAELSSLSQTDSNCANEQPRNISQTIESNLETALAAIKERADKEKLGTDAEEDKAAASADSSPCSRPLPIIRGSSSAQTEKSVPNGPAETSQKTKAGESNSSVEETCDKSLANRLQEKLLEKDCSSHRKENMVLTNSDETSKKTTEVLELSVVNDDDSDGLGNADQEVDDVEMENLEVACNKDSGCKVNSIKNNGDSCKDILTSSEMDSKDGPVPNGDINVHTSSSNKSTKQCSIPDSSGDHRQARSGLEQSCESSTRSTADNPTESQLQNDQLQASPSNKSVPEAEKSLVSNAAPSPRAYANTPSNILDSSSQNNTDKMVSCEKSNISDKNISLSDKTPLTSAQQETFKEGFEIVEESDAAEEDRVKSISIITQEKTSHSVHVPTDVAKTRTNYANEESPQAALDKMRKNVYRLLQLLVPGKDLGDISNIDKLVEDMVRDEESSSQSKCLSGSSHHESASS